MLSAARRVGRVERETNWTRTKTSQFMLLLLLLLLLFLLLALLLLRLLLLLMLLLLQLNLLPCPLRAVGHFHQGRQKKLLKEGEFNNLTKRNPRKTQTRGTASSGGGGTGRRAHFQAGRRRMILLHRGGGLTSRPAEDDTPTPVHSFSLAGHKKT